MRFEFEDTKPVITNEQLLADIRRVSTDLASPSLPQRTYRVHGMYSTTAIKSRFGTWNAAIAAAGLAHASEWDIPETDLHRNLAEVWMAVGRQPRKRDMSLPVSRFTHHPYVRRYRSWLSAVRAFLATVESRDATVAELRPSPECPRPHGPRDPSLRLRFLVMRTDHFSCRHCGASPAKDQAVELHVDHVVPWEKGGPTTLENLQTLCTRCNLGKSSFPNQGDG